MATIPIIDQTTQQLTPSRSNQVQSGPSIQPTVNAIPDQIKQAGQAMEQVGQAVGKYEEDKRIEMQKIEDQNNDAEVKRVSNDFAIEIDKSILEFNALQGKAAVDGAVGLPEKMEEIRLKYKDSLANEKQKMMFEPASQIRTRSFNMTTQTRALKEQQQYDINETKASVEVLTVDAIRSHGSKDEFKMYSDAAVKEANILADKLGYDKKSSQREALINKVNNNISAQSTDSFVNAEEFEEAYSFLDKQYKSKKIDQKQYEKLKKTVESGFNKENGIQLGNEIFAQYAEIDDKGVPNLGFMNDEIAKIKDDDQRRMAKATATNLRNDKIRENAENYQNNLNMASDVAFARPGGFKDVAPSAWAKLSGADQRRLERGIPKKDDQDTRLKYIKDPELITEQNLKNDQGKLSESTYRQLYKIAVAPDKAEKVLAITMDKEQLNTTLINNKLNYLVNPNTPQEKESAIMLQDQVKDRIDDAQSIKGSKLNRDETQKVIDSVMLNKASVGFWNPVLKPIAAMTESELKKVRVSDIPSDELSRLKNHLRSKGIDPSDETLVRLWTKANRR